MKNLKTFEAFWQNPYDKTVKKLFNRIKEIFEMDRLSKRYGQYSYIYTYELEETDSQLGYIKIEVEKQTIIRTGVFYSLKIDDESVKCSESLMKDIYNYFKDKEENKEEKIKNFNNKYKNV